MQALEMEDQDQKTPEFRFSTRKKYEEALVRLAQDGDDETYEALAEEYVRFCDAEMNG
jgi:hypothetical protein